MVWRRWWLFSPRRLALIAALVTLGVIFFTSNEAEDDAYRRPLPLHKQGLPAPHFDAPLAQKHNELRRNILEKKLTPEEDEESKLGYERNSFNQFVSDRLPLDRQFPDARNPECFQQRYHPRFTLPTTSVIIIFHNEAVSTLLRTAWSVVNRSPAELLEEILLVDDASTGEWLQNEEFEEKVNQIPKVRVIRLPERSGLIRAKVAGAKEARGEVLTFLDSHCECNPGWLEPLLDPIRRDPTTVVAPTIDVISDKTFEYMPAASVLQRGSFSWYLIFGWLELTEAMKSTMASPVEPFESPAMAGGLFSIDRQYFFDIGTYDMGMEVWGGENLEMSFRIWMCGGRIENVPCSRVGHVFRTTNPVKFKDNDPGKTITRNLNRVADVWMDQYADIYRSLNGLDPEDGKSDVSDRVALRKALKCKSFDWYLKRVFPDLFVPTPPNVHKMGIVQNVATGLCLDTKTNDFDSIKRAHLSACDPLTDLPETERRYPHEQLIFFTANPANTLRKIELFADKCIVVVPDTDTPRDDATDRLPDDILWFNTCKQSKDEEWSYLDSGQLYHRRSGKCAEARTSGESTVVIARECKRSNPRQRWVFHQTTNVS